MNATISDSKLTCKLPTEFLQQRKSTMELNTSQQIKSNTRNRFRTLIGCLLLTTLLLLANVETHLNGYADEPISQENPKTLSSGEDALKSLKEELTKALRHPDMEATVDQLREFEPRFLRLAHHSLNRAESSWKPGPTSVTFLCRPQISAAPFQCSG